MKEVNTHTKGGREGSWIGRIAVDGRLHGARRGAVCDNDNRELRRAVAAATADDSQKRIGNGSAQLVGNDGAHDRGVDGTAIDPVKRQGSLNIDLIA